MAIFSVALPLFLIFPSVSSLYVNGNRYWTSCAPFVSWLNTQKPLFGALLETHIKKPNLSPILSKLCPGWMYLSNHSSDPDGRIILIWKQPLSIQFLTESSQHLTVSITLPNQAPIIYTAIYASNESSERVDLWTNLLRDHSVLDLDNKSWVVGGDLNQILFPLEHSSPEVSFMDNLMFQLQDCLIQAGLFDLRYLGPCHTWTNKRPDSPIAKKLDRLLVNSSTISDYPHAVATFLPTDFSDHSPCLLNLAYSLPKAGTYPYKFPNYLTKHPGFAQLINDAWIHSGSVSHTLTQLCWKCLLQNAQVQALNDPTATNFQAEKDLNQKWNFLREIEEIYFLQKSRINWLKEGDFNTAFFHRICQVRSSYNAVRAFLDASGVWITDPLEMSLLAVHYFQSILGPQLLPPPSITSEPHWFATLLNFSVSQSHCTHMLTIPRGSSSLHGNQWEMRWSNRLLTSSLQGSYRLPPMQLS